MIFNINKPAGMTPLEALESLRASRPELAGAPMTYAGRLDPLACGVLVVLTGEDVHSKEQFLGLDKQYEAEILFGFETDSYDILGIPSAASRLPSQESIRKSISALIGVHNLAIPPFSSVPVGGRPLFEWARSGKIFEIAIPRRDMNFKKIRISEISSLSSEDILNHIRRSVFKVRGDFRQEQTLSEWERVLKNGNASYPLSKISVECSAGSYVRSLAYESGRNSESCAVLFSLKRTRVGNFTIADSIRPESN